MVVLRPASTTLNSRTSWAPKPVNLVWAESGAINVQPEVVRVRLEHFVKYVLRLRADETLSARYQKLSGIPTQSDHMTRRKGLKAAAS